MGFVERAKSMHARGEAVRASVILAQGLKRDPSDVEAVEWLLHMYVDELPTPGIEKDVLQVLERQPNGAYLLDLVRAELEEVDGYEKLHALDKTLAQGRFVLRDVREPDPEPVAAAPAPAPSDTPPPTPEPAAVAGRGENWDAFDSPFDGEPSGMMPAASSSAPPAVADESDQVVLGTLDTLPEHLKAEYLPTEPAQPTGRGGVWIIALAAIALGALIVAYFVTAGDDAETATPAWADEGSAG